MSPLEELKRTSERLRSDAVRFEGSLRTFSLKTYPDSLDGLEAKMTDVDEIETELLCILGHLGVIILGIYSNDYPAELFDLTGTSRNEFLSQVSMLKEHYKRCEYLLCEKSRTLRTIYGMKSARINNSVLFEE